MKAVAVGDLLLPASVFDETIRSASWVTAYDSFDWDVTKKRDELRNVVRRMETGGSRAFLPTQEELERLKDAEVILSHLFTIPREVFEAAPKLRYILSGTRRRGKYRPEGRTRARRQRDPLPGAQRHRRRGIRHRPDDRGIEKYRARRPRSAQRHMDREIPGFRSHSGAARLKRRHHRLRHHRPSGRRAAAGLRREDPGQRPVRPGRGRHSSRLRAGQQGGASAPQRFCYPARGASARATRRSSASRSCAR